MKGDADMADYIAATRTSYFKVTDEKKYQVLFAGLESNGDDIRDFTEKDNDGSLWHAFGSYGEIDWYPPSNEDDDYVEPDSDRFYDELSKIMADDCACVIMSAGHENLRYIGGYVVVITKDKVSFNNLNNMAYTLMGEAGIDYKKVQLDY